MSEPKHVVVLGAGLVGRAMVLDLAQEPGFDVTAVDLRADALTGFPTEIQTIEADVLELGVAKKLVKNADLVVCAVPGFMGYRTLRAVLEAGVDVVDISFFPEDPFTLAEIAAAQGVKAIVDCGVAPGLCNILAARAASQLDRVDSYCCYVGGLPAIRRWPFEYGAVFSPTDVLEEYLRPARVVEGGKIVVKEALSGREQLDVPGLGTLEAFNTDGLRTMLTTFPARELHEKTLRYPGHADIMAVFREAGFLSKEAVQVGAAAIRPFDLSAQLLRKYWTMAPGEEDVTVMRVEVKGARGGELRTLRYDLLDRYDVATGISSMARTTGYTATLVARMVLDGSITKPGILPPEELGGEVELFDRLMQGYAARCISIQTAVLP